MDKLKELVREIMLQEEQTGIMDSLMAEAEDLPDKITAGIFSLGTDYQIRQYVCWHMHGLVRLGNSLYKHGQQHREFALKRALVVVLGTYEELLRMFPEHAPGMVELPLVWHDRMRIRLKKFEPEFTAKLQAKKIDERLIGISLIPMRDFLSHRTQPVGFEEYQYLSRFISGLERLDFDSGRFAVPGYTLVEKLIQLNFNHVHFLDYCAAGMAEYLVKYRPEKERQQVLTVAMKALKQVVTVEGSVYQKHNPPIRTSMESCCCNRFPFM